MATETTSKTETVWNDLQETSPNSSNKPLSLQLPSPRIHEDVTQNQLSQIESPPSYNNNSKSLFLNESNLPRIPSSDHDFNYNQPQEIIEQITLHDCVIPNTPPLTNHYVSDQTVSTVITTNTSHRNSLLSNITEDNLLNPTVWNDSNKSSPTSTAKQLTDHLPSPRIPPNITQKQQSYDSYSNQPSVPPGLPRIPSPYHNFDEKKAQNLTQLTNTMDEFDNMINSVIMTEYATNPQHSQSKSIQSNNNSNNSNNSSNNKSNNNGHNLNSNNRYNKRNNGDEKRRDTNDDIKDEYKSKPNLKNMGHTYHPNRIYTNRDIHIKISKPFTLQIIPRNIKQNYIQNVYDFLYKSIAINIYDGNYCDSGNFTIFYCGFQNALGKRLFVVIDKPNQKNNQYIMRDILYTKNEILQELSKTSHGYGLLPLAPRISTDDMKEICNAFDEPAALCQNVIFKTKWHKLYVFNTMNNKQRLTFSIEKTEFVNIVQQFIYNGNNKVLLPIVMFSDIYRVEYIQIVRLRENIHIGISYIYDRNDGTVKVTGIHLNRNDILNQHQLVCIEHNCHCLDSFNSDIDCLDIGNPDDDKNRLKDLKNKHEKLKIQFKQQNTEMNVIQMEKNMLKAENDVLKQLLLPPIICTSTPVTYTPQTYTPQTRSTLRTNSIVSSLMTPPGNNFPYTYTPTTNQNMNNFPTYPMFIQNNNNCNNLININTPQSVSANSTPYSVPTVMGTPQSGYINIGHGQLRNSQPNMNMVINNGGKRQHNQNKAGNSNDKSLNQNNNDMNNDGDASND